MREVVAALDSYRAGNRLPVPMRDAFGGSAAARSASCLLLVLAGAVGVERFFWPKLQDIDRFARGQAGATRCPGHCPPKIWSFADLMTLIRDDLDRQVDSGDQPFQRYFTLTNLANDPDVSPRILQRHRDALTQLLPALVSVEPTAPKPIDAERSVFRVDTKALGWTDESFRKKSTATTHTPCSSRRTPPRTNFETWLMTWSAGSVRSTATTRLTSGSTGSSRPSATHNAPEPAEPDSRKPRGDRGTGQADRVAA